MIIKTEINWGFRAHDLGRSPAKELALKIAGKGFHHIQLALQKAISGIDASYGSLSPGMGHLIGGEFMKQDIRISVLGCYINPIHLDRKIRNDNLNRFVEHLKYCRDFGCSVVRTETGTPPPENGGMMTALMKLYESSGDKKYLDFCDRFIDYFIVEFVLLQALGEQRNEMKVLNILCQNL